MYCAHCGFQVPDGAQFCGKCGASTTAATVSAPAVAHANIGTELVEQFRALPLDTLFPFRSWAHGKIWTGNIIRALLFFALFPLALGDFFGEDASVKDAAWALGLYFALLWGWVIYSITRPPKVNLQYLIGVTLFTAAIGVPIDLLVQQLPIISNLYNAASPNAGILALFGYLCVGVVEESVKQLPVWWLALRSKVFTTPRETAFYGAMSGLAFGVSEAVTYSLGYANQAINTVVQGGNGEGTYIVSEFLRLISLPFFHAMWAAIASYFVGLALVSPKRRAALVITGVALAAAVHGCYDTLSGWSPWLALVVAAVSVVLFVGYLSNAESLSKSLEDQAPAAIQ
ncbi:MAG TPA: PrsW family intramembrane metalloprotease [Candidatus Eremiobacteraceae bacterium]|nr:PrsW family intramembrane metalloprotease [Candidatus Eremiobacteraceae bacterium]